MTHTAAKHMRVVPIDDVTENPQSHITVLKQLKEGYETLTRQRGEKGDWAVTFTDLVELGIITEEQANEHIARRRGL